MKIAELFEMRTDSQEFDNLDTADRWLARYTYEGLDRWPSPEVRKILAQRYPLTKPTMVYRGMNFRTQEEYEQFRDSIHDGVLEIGGVSSWGLTREDARQFALVRPTYFPDRETFAQEKIARENGEDLRGYRGVVLSTTLQPGQGIDVNASGKGHESEIIALPGSYRITVEDIKTYHEQVQDGSLNISRFIANVTAENINDKENNSKLHHILKTKMTLLTSKDRMHLFKIYSKDAGKTKYDTREFSDWNDESIDYKERLVFHYRYSFFQKVRDGLFGKEFASIVKRYANAVWRGFINATKEHPDAYLEARSIGYIAELADKNIEFSRFMKERIGKRYAALNAREETSQVKTRDDLHKVKKRFEILMKQYQDLQG